MQVLKDQLAQAQRDADTVEAKYIRTEAKFTELQNQLAAHAPAPQIATTVKSTAAALVDLKTANIALQHTLTPESARLSLTGGDVKFTVTRKSN